MYFVLKNTLISLNLYVGASQEMYLRLLFRADFKADFKALWPAKSALAEVLKDKVAGFKISMIKTWQQME